MKIQCQPGHPCGGYFMAWLVTLMYRVSSIAAAAKYTDEACACRPKRSHVYRCATTPVHCVRVTSRPRQQQQQTLRVATRRQHRGRHG